MTALPSDVVEWLDALELERPEITPDVLVALAENPDCPAHKLFQWDNEKAADSFRRDQARRILAVRVTIQRGETRAMVPRYVRSPFVKGNEQGLISVRSIPSASETAARILEIESDRVLAATERMESVAQLLNAEEEVKAVKRAAKRVKNASERRPSV